MLFQDKIKSFFAGESRTVLLKKNIIGTLILKGISIIISFLIVPLTIDFVDPTQYGIWLTLSSLLSWLFFFDIGMTNGFRNRFAEAKAKNDILLARTLVSTTYATLIILSAIMLVIVLPVNHFLNWSEILKIDNSYQGELTKVFMIMIICLGGNLVAQVFSTMVTADQKPFLSSLVQVLGQAVSLILILIFTITVKHGNLIELALIFSSSPVVVLIIFSIVFYHTRYRIYSPSIRFVRFSLVKDILGIGSQFFIITTSMLFIFQLMNVIISRVLGPDSVTEYNIAFKYFNILYMIVVIIVNPFWSAFTDAYNRKDFSWMRRMIKKLETLGFLSVMAIIAMYFVADYFYRFWVKDMVTVSTSINISVAIYVLLLLWGNIYMAMINGIGTVRIQLIIYLSFAVIAYPLMTFMCEKYGIPGLLFIPCLVFFIQSVLGKIQLRKLMKGCTSGIWAK